MKLNYLIIATLIVVSCGGNTNSKQTGFAPKDRTTVEMSESERRNAIEAKKAENGVDLNVALASNDVKLSVMPPYPKGDITEAISECIAVKLLHLTTANGIGGLNNVPGFALCASMEEIDKKLTSTAPQKMVVKYTISYSVRNLVTDDVYASCEQELTGVGGSWEEATRNAVNEIKNNALIQKMLSTASEKIINWYNENLETFKRQVMTAMGTNDYAYALALINSVPEKATGAFEYTASVREEVLAKFKMQSASKELTAMKQAILASENALSPEVYAHLSLIPTDAPEYQEAIALSKEYESQVNKQREQEKLAKISAEERLQQLEMAKLESERVIVQYQSDAVNEQIQKLERELEYERRGFWGSIGSRVVKLIDSF